MRNCGERLPAEKMDKDGVPLVMKLHKSLYGLAQSPGNWFMTIDPELVALGLVPLKSDTCVYIDRKNGVVIILTLCVDDLLLVGACLLYTSPSPRDLSTSRMPSSA